MSFYKDKLNFYSQSEYASIPLEDRMQIVKNDVYRSSVARFVETSNYILNHSTASSGSLGMGGVEASFHTIILDEQKKEFESLQNMSTQEYFDLLIDKETQAISKLKYLELENIKNLRNPYIERPISALFSFLTRSSQKETKKNIEEKVELSSIKFGVYSVVSDEWRNDLTDEERISYLVGRYEIEKLNGLDEQGLNIYVQNKISAETTEEAEQLEMIANEQ